MRTRRTFSGDTAERCKMLFDMLGGEFFAGAFDFADFVQCGEDLVECYNQLEPYIRYFHRGVPERQLTGKDVVSDQWERNKKMDPALSELGPGFKTAISIIRRSYKRLPVKKRAALER